MILGSLRFAIWCRSSILTASSILIGLARKKCRFRRQHRLFGQPATIPQAVATAMPGARALPYSLDDLIGPQEERLRDRQAERLRGLEVDDQLELRRLLDRNIGRPSALQNLVHIGCGAPVHVGVARPV